MFDGAADAQQLVAQACMETRELLTPVLESAAGVKADLVSRGWSEVNAESVATAYVQGMLAKVFGAL